MRTTGDEVIRRSSTALEKVDRARLTTSRSVDGARIVARSVAHP